MDLDDPLA